MNFWKWRERKHKIQRVWRDNKEARFYKHNRMMHTELPEAGTIDKGLSQVWDKWDSSIERSRHKPGTHCLEAISSW